MADFTVRVEGATAAPWVERDVVGDPSRLSPRAGFPERRWLAEPGSIVTFLALIDGSMPMDPALDGRLFFADLVEGSSYPEFLPAVPGNSAQVRVRFDWSGHFAIAIRRPGGGAEIIPIDVKAP